MKYEKDKNKLIDTSQVGIVVYIFYLGVLADDAFVVVVDAVAALAHSHDAAFVDAADVPLAHIADDAFVPFVDANAYL